MTTAPLCKALRSPWKPADGICEAPVSDQAYLCSPCAQKLARDLGDVPWLAEELRTTISRLSRGGTSEKPGKRGKLSAAALPYDADVAAKADHLRATLVTWCLLIADERGVMTPDDTLEAMSRFLLASCEWLRHFPASDEALTQIRRAVSDARRAVDLRPDRVFVGSCPLSAENGGPCPAELFAIRGAQWVECLTCGWKWEVAPLRTYLLEAAREELETATVLSKFLTAYGEPVTKHRIGMWRVRGLLVPHGHDEHGNPLYRVGDAMDVHARMLAGRRRSA